MRLMVVRHAKAAWPGGVADIDRPLAPRGITEARELGVDLAERKSVPDAALVSPALRTRQTWDLMKASWADGPRPVIDDKIYEGGAWRLLNAIRSRGGIWPSLMLVGHNPGVLDLVEALATDIERVPMNFAPATLVVLEFDLDSWSTLEPDTGDVVRVRAAR
ncbi:MAG: histidine phosphatase family protein [Microbacterium sp.]